MNRNLDLGTLRSLVAIAETGGVTRAANRLHLTQSAVSMQVRRMEDVLSVKLLEREGRQVRLTPEGDRLVDAARQLLPINDQVVAALTTPRYEGQLSLGVPNDVVHPHLPPVLRRFAREYPRVSVTFATGATLSLKRDLREGRHDLILGTEDRPSKGGVVLAEQALVWTGAVDGRAWRQRPLPIALCRNCIFRKPLFHAVKGVGIDTTEVVDTASDDATLVAVASDMAVTVELASADSRGCQIIDHGGELPDLGVSKVTCYVGKGQSRELAEIFAGMLAEQFDGV